MGALMDGRKEAWIEGWIDGWKDERVDRWLDGRMAGYMDCWMYSKNGRVKERNHEWKDGWVD